MVQQHEAQPGAGRHRRPADRSRPSAISSTTWWRASREREALVSRHEGLRYSYRELQREPRTGWPARCWSSGLQPGDRVGIWSHNNAAWVLMQIATAKAGLILVNINPAYRTAEVEYALNKVGCKTLVTMARFKTSDYLGMLRELAPELAARQPGELKSRGCRS